MSHDGRAGRTVAQLARATGLRADTVRYYERIGLLLPPPRSSTGYRRYGEDAVDRVHFIQGAQRLGLRLKDIGELLRVRDSGVCPCGDAAELLRERVAQIDHELSRLTAQRAELARMVSRIPSEDCPNPEPGVWRPLSDEPDRADPVRT